MSENTIKNVSDEITPIKVRQETLDDAGVTVEQLIEGLNRKNSEKEVFFYKWGCDWDMWLIYMRAKT